MRVSALYMILVLFIIAAIVLIFVYCVMDIVAQIQYVEDIPQEAYRNHRIET